eukprot:CAMPEP_0118922164 /NCGR_PEP_ID=MMETSP1169-20130426/1183_1 /TAXON_ID=36882 /ORGANISM="Pyramimonas obovata, Strain CCMP722" /LENGTH=129 /DNA_ID=CAMNT_0006862993 /DNA_START=74 /DNA_END=463 /DNA_ORIENTATION=-
MATCSIALSAGQARMIASTNPVRASKRSSVVRCASDNVTGVSTPGNRTRNTHARREALMMTAASLPGLLFFAEAASAKGKSGIRDSAEKGAGDCYPVCDAGTKAKGDAEMAKMMAIIEARKKEAAQAGQ